MKTELVKSEVIHELREWNSNFDNSEPINSFFKKQPHDFIEQVESLNNQIVPMDANNKISICVPVVAFGNQETDSVETFLKQLSEINNKNFEVIFFCNYPEGETLDHTFTLIKKLSERCEFKVHVMLACFPESKVNVGYFRSLLHAVVLKRSLKVSHDVIHIVLDVDTTYIPPTFIDGYLRAFSKENVELVIGQLYWGPTPILPQLWVGQSLMALLPKYGNWHMLKSSSICIKESSVFGPSFGEGKVIQANYAFSGSAYASVGGFRKQACHEHDFLVRLIMTKGNFTNTEVLWDEVKVLSHPRRVLHALEQGKPPIQQWQAKTFHHNDHVRNNVPNLEYHADRYCVKELETHINLTLETYPLEKAYLVFAVVNALMKIGLDPSDYELTLKESLYSGLSLASINIKSENRFTSKLKTLIESGSL